MTDWLSTMKGVADSALCLKAGNDLLMPGTKRDKKVILKALKKGLISENDIRRSAMNVVRVIMQGRSGCYITCAGHGYSFRLQYVLRARATCLKSTSCPLSRPLL
jgi:hypothetical protein